MAAARRLGLLAGGIGFFTPFFRFSQENSAKPAIFDIQYAPFKNTPHLRRSMWIKLILNSS